MEPEADEPAEEEERPEEAERWQSFYLLVLSEVAIPLRFTMLVPACTSNSPPWQWNRHASPVLQHPDVVSALGTDYDATMNRITQSWAFVMSRLSQHDPIDGADMDFVWQYDHEKPTAARFLEALTDAGIIMRGPLPRGHAARFCLRQYRHRVIHVALDRASVEFCLESSLPGRCYQTGVGHWKGFQSYIETGCNRFTVDGAELPSCRGQVIAEVHLAIEQFVRERIHLPAWLVLPRDRPRTAQANQLPDCFHDPGNEAVEALFHLVGLQKLLTSSLEHRLRMLQLPAAPYGDRTNQSSVGPVNRRGNMIEGMLNFLWRKSALEHGRGNDSTTERWQKCKSID